jgi:hypothetical protein
MKISFENKSDKVVLINLNSQQEKLSPLSSDIFTLEGSRVSMNLTTEDNYSSEKFSTKMGYCLGHRFVTKSLYDFTSPDELHIELSVERKKGDHFDSYQRVIPYCKDFSLPEPIYTLKNEDEVNSILDSNKSFEDKAEKTGELYLKLDKADTVISNIVFWVLSLGISAVIFVALWQIFSLKAAIITVAFLALISQLIYRIIKKLIDGVGKTADKVLSSKVFDKAMDKVNDKFVYCKNMPEDLYKDESSYFDSNYISAVFRYSTKAI